MEAAAQSQPVAKPAPAPAHQIALRVSDLGKRYLLHGRMAGTKLLGKVKDDDVFWALRGVSFSIAEGERVGVIGRNGAGKSTLLKILSRVVAPSEGRAEIRGRIASLLEVGTGFNPALTGRENVFLNAALFGLSRKDVEARLGDIIAFAEIGRFIDEPVKVYSTGMRSRLGFAIAAHLDPDVLMLDEVLSVGDAAFQSKCLARVGELVSGERTLLFVSHSIGAIRQFCDRCLWLDGGQLLMDGPADQVVQAYTDRVMKLSATVAFAPPKRKAAPRPQEEAPKGGMVGARIVADTGQETSHVFVDAPFGVEVDYEIYEDDSYVLPVFRFYAEDGQHVFTAAPNTPDVAEWRRKAGRYRSRVAVPAHLMNLGLHRVSIGLTTPRSGGLIRHHVEENALTFWVHEAPPGRRSALGPYSKLKGAVRPMLDWTHDGLDGAPHE